MPITDIITHVPNIGPTAQVTIGVNTPAPYNAASVTAATDGTNVQTATKNMAEIYNRQLFSAKHLIEAAGLVFDPLNWAQQTQAVQAVASSAVPTATDTTQGKVALNLGTAAGDATNATDALTATGLAAILNGTAPNTTPNALQAAVASNPSQYGAFPSVLAPTAAPTVANPATRLTNSNGEVFDWTGTAWVPVGNLLLIDVNTSGVSLPMNSPVLVGAATLPRTGRVLVSHSSGVSSGTAILQISSYFKANGGLIARAGSFIVSTAGLTNYEWSSSTVYNATAGDIITFEALQFSTTALSLLSFSKLQIQYI